MLNQEEFNAILNATVPPDAYAEIDFSYIVCINLYIKDILAKLNPKMGNFEKYKQHILALYNRLFLWVDSLSKLNNRNCYFTVIAIERAAFELMIDIVLLEKKLVSDVDMKIETYTRMSRYRNAEKIVKYVQSHPDAIFHEYEIAKQYYDSIKRDEYEKAVAKVFWKKNKKPRKCVDHWSGIDNLRDRAKAIGKKYEELYLQIYPNAGFIMHSDPTAFAIISPRNFAIGNFVAYEYIKQIIVDATHFTLDALDENQMKIEFDNIKARQDKQADIQVLKISKKIAGIKQ